MTYVDVVVLCGAMPSSVALSLDVLATANRLAENTMERTPFRIRLSGSGSAGWADLSGVSVAPHERPAHLLIVPGLGLSRQEEVVERLKADDVRETQVTLGAALDQGAEIATSCSGAFLLATAGLLAGRRATTSWWLAPIFRQLHPGIDLVMDQLIVRDGPITTAGASLAQMDLMLNLVARFAGADVADRCSRYMLLDERRSQSRYMALGYLAGADEKVARAEAWARAHLSEDMSINALASAAGLAPRTFARRVEKVTGLSPIRFLQRLRIEAATDLIETTRLPVEEVARRVGYADPSALRRIMQRESGLRPGSLRRSEHAG